MVSVHTSRSGELVIADADPAAYASTVFNHSSIQIFIHVLAFFGIMVIGFDHIRKVLDHDHQHGPGSGRQADRIERTADPRVQTDPKVLKRVLERYIPVVTIISGALVGTLAAGAKSHRYGRERQRDRGLACRRHHDPVLRGAR